METTQQKVERLQAELDALNAQSPRNVSVVNQTESALEEAKRELEQEQASMVRIQGQEEKRDNYTLPVDLEALFSSSIHLDASGNPYVPTSANHIVSQIVKNALRENDEEWFGVVDGVESKWTAKYNELESKCDNAASVMTAQLEEKDRLNKEQEGLIEELRRQLSQAVIDKEDAEAKRDAAVRDRKERDAKESQDLATLIAEQQAEKERKAAEDRAKRTVYDVVPDSAINPKNFTAKLAATGEPISYNWTQQKSYIVLTDEDEILQFRNQHANTNVDQQDHAVSTEPVQNGLTQEATFPDVPRAEAPEVPTQPVQVDPGQPSGEVSTAQVGAVTRAEFEALRAEVMELKGKVA